jgi:hypothetical protein
MKKSIFAKMLVLVLALVTVFAFATTAFAVYDEYIYNRSVHGGPSEFMRAISAGIEPNPIRWMCILSP